MNFEWAHIIIGALGLAGGATSGIFAAGWRLGRIESRLKLYMQSSIIDSEKRFEDKVDLSTKPFDETLKGLRQKINDVELATERRFLPRGDFDDFREEYRQDMRDLKNSVAEIAKTH